MLNDMKYAVIGGSVSGLAQATINELLKKGGWRIFALDIRNEEKDEGGVKRIRADLTSSEDLERAKGIVEEETGQIHFLSSFAGCVILGSLFEKAEGKAERMLKLTFLTTFNTNRVFIPMVIKAKGTVAVISSEYGKITAIPLHGYYPFAKHAIESYADSLRRELKRSGAKVTTIRPGAFRTAMQEAVNGQFDSLLEETEIYKTPLKRMKFLMTGELKKAKDPAILGRKLSKIAEMKRPRAHYNVCNSLKMKLLTILPSPLQDWIFSVFFG